MKKLTILLVVLVGVLLTSCNDGVKNDDLMNDVINHEWFYVGVSFDGVLYEGVSKSFTYQFLPNGKYITHTTDDFDNDVMVIGKWVYKGNGIVDLGRIKKYPFTLSLDNSVLKLGGYLNDDYTLLKHN